MSLIEMKELGKKYGGSGTATVALSDINLTIEAGECVAIMGPSGSGKSTLMNIIGLLDRPSDGSYTLENKDVSNLKDVQLATIRSARIGFIFQSFNLLQRHTALENVALPMLYAGVRKSTTRLNRAAKLLDQVGLEDRYHYFPNELSGGQMQRVAIARALANKPSIILADEPTGNLDSAAGKQIMELLDDLNKKGNTVIIVTHDEYVAAHAQRTIHLLDGKLVDSPTPAKKTATKKAKKSKSTKKKKTTKEKTS